VSVDNEVARLLARYVVYARHVRDVLPVDDNAERSVDAMMSKRSIGHRPRKLTRGRP
jgi:hypothetical protein